MARRFDHDVIVIGSGAAGLSAALRLADRNRSVAVITKTALGEGATAMAQGGLAAVLPPGVVASEPGDSYRRHVEDTLAAGAGMCDPAAVAALVKSAPNAVTRLIELGANFDRTPDGRIALGLEGGHSARRIVHAGGVATGAEVARVLAKSVRTAAADRPNLMELVEHTMVTDLITAPGPTGRPRVTGVRLADTAGAIADRSAAAVVLATGGIGRLWSATTNPATATGDGLALALRAGAIVRDVEFMQFHPTLLAAGGQSALISEAVRGEGATLIDPAGYPVMTGGHPLGDLAPRDVVAAAIEHRMRTSGFDHVLLDGTRLGEVWTHHFPTLLSVARRAGLDPRRDPLPVRPGAHYHCGGVAATLTGATSLDGLFAVGEVAATGVHGANRLASNSVTEALVSGAALADRLAALHLSRPAGPGEVAPRGGAAVAESADAGGYADVSELADAHTGVVRHASGLSTMLDSLAGLGSTPGTERSNLILAARVLATAALIRTESRGCHRRADHPTAWPGEARRLSLRLDVDGRIQLVTDGKERAA